MNKSFFKMVALISSLWGFLGMGVCWLKNYQQASFFEPYALTLLSLVLMIVIVRTLLLSELPGFLKIGKIIIFSFFKLVCISFLAITLKRFQELPILPMLMGVSIYWIAPALAGVLCKRI